MAKFIIEESNEKIISHSGIAIIGQLLSKTQLKSRLNAVKLRQNGRKRTPVSSNKDIAYSYIGLLCQGKSDFEHIEPFREDSFFAYALEIDHIPSCSTLRQRLDLAGATRKWEPILLEESAKLLRKINAPLTPILINDTDYMPLDIDVSPFDNSGTKKEGVSRTYKGVDGFAPIFAYLAQEGYLVHVEHRRGSDHCQKGTPEFIRKSIQYAKKVTDTRLLLRADSGNDSKDNLKICHEEKSDFIIKRNPRKETAEGWLMIAKKHGMCCEEREGKTVYRGFLNESIKGLDRPVRLVFEVIERTSDRDGQTLLLPEISFDTYWTSLTCPATTVIDLYHDHGTSEQFHSELKSELDLERLPSGKFDTNSLVLHFGLFAYNLLRLIGQVSLQKEDAPLKKKVQRRRIRTVIQNYMTLAAKFVIHARQRRLKIGTGNRWIPSFQRIYQAFSI
ncbi:IS1380 family transposase [Fictibacillus sp. Mic-4]|uniref:IS1380 family transposase n=1 Tax=Fictibacillus TaxID=1329200 RepID=UPI000416ED1F|nr:IS1380 family transposase [Fictibacillus gelatini]HAJ3957502.1 IS1380 family transposase [Escherichia coli]